ncbi:carboxylesterase/lipase family protein [Streptomyces sp. NPDC000888]
MSSAEPEVRTAAGLLRGREEGGLAVFRGIPFARPPLGELRFAAPRPVLPWKGVREAVTFGPPPPQSAALGAPGAPPVTDSDWLTVNVWSPGGTSDGPDGLPVMVWIYGGAYLLGEAGDVAYDGAVLARQGVVVVSFNYRLGMEGFAHIEGAPANRGLLDQVAALEWVRDNIAAFGGDPGRVTVFGESAGAGSIASLLAMPRAAGLFHRAIAQSVPGTFFSADLAADIARAAAAELGLRPTVADLAGVEPGRLVAAGDAVAAKMVQYEERWGAVAHTPTPFSPVVDGDVLPLAPWQALAEGSARDVELIVGHNRDEYRLFVALADRLGRITEEHATTALRVFAPGPDGPRAYRTAFPDADAAELYERVHTDWLFAAPSLHLAQAHVTAGGRAHLYELTWSSPAFGGTLGACHGLDIPLVFGTLGAGLALVLLGDEVPPIATDLSRRIRTAWTAFAAHGDPGWPPYDAEHRLTRVWDAVPSVTAYPEDTARLIWRDHAFGALPLL